MKSFFYMVSTGLVGACALAQASFLEALVQEGSTALRSLSSRSAPKRSYPVITSGIKPTIPPLPLRFSETQQGPLPSKGVRFLDPSHTRFVVDQEPAFSINPPRHQTAR